MVDISLIIGGPQGGGIESAGQIAIKSMVLLGYEVLGSREYHSNIMGAHSYYHLRVQQHRPRSLKLPVDGVLALDAESVFTHFRDVRPGGILVYDPGTKSTRVDAIQPMAGPLKKRLKSLFDSRGMQPVVESAVTLAEEAGARIVGLPLKEMLKTLSERTGAPVARVSRALNTLGLASMLYMLGVPVEYIEKAIALQFAGKEKVITMNVEAVRIAVDYVREAFGEPESRLPPGPRRGQTMMVATGNDLVAMGKIVGGLGVITYYPITPSSDEALYVEKHSYISIDGPLAEKLGYDKIAVAIVQMEDELASINAVLGAAAAGARASTTTSGPGFSLMNEAVSLAVEAEIPVVVTLWMRAGPSTGMPTRTGQQDLLHSIFSGHGDAPKIVLASGDHVEAFYDAIKAFNWAEEFQTPVIHLLDKYLASSMVSLAREDLDPSKVPITRGKLLDNPPADYKRYEVVEDGISPRARLGSATMVITGLEHDEYGYATEDPVMREIMMFKRERKFKVIEERIPDDEKAVLHGDPDASVALVSFGSTKQPILEALEMLRDEGVRARFAQIRLLYPFPGRLVEEMLEGVEKVIMVEQNLLGQLAMLLRAHTSIKPDSSIVKINGRPLYSFEVAGAVKRILETGEERVVVSHGS
ncbi:2-oxoacid:ferredoxin oxidoreductase alpha subunit [Aeropyrum pernix]|uniref:2-oxoacid oxidoreductase (ferredoxin) n=1 Tax=Aeropyrum pernix TaxID=56636 RepID=A0A401HB89_AERPX|nr:2-oxoacid:ferredoxin oxidoreductase subunit alpha [Aeropyrum pernix]GBF09640.1 2-oxoacid:ferredoxin oxidoreductase alpha subunit [Aeropyrum pernix]